MMHGLNDGSSATVSLPAVSSLLSAGTTRTAAWAASWTSWAAAGWRAPGAGGLFWFLWYLTGGCWCWCWWWRILIWSCGQHLGAQLLQSLSQVLARLGQGFGVQLWFLGQWFTSLRATRWWWRWRWTSRGWWWWFPGEGSFSVGGRMLLLWLLLLLLLLLLNVQVTVDCLRGVRGWFARRRSSVETTWTQERHAHLLRWWWWWGGGWCFWWWWGWCWGGRCGVGWWTRRGDLDGGFSPGAGAGLVDSGELELYEHHVVPQPHCQVERSSARQKVIHLEKRKQNVNIWTIYTSLVHHSNSSKFS